MPTTTMLLLLLSILVAILLSYWQYLRDPDKRNRLHYGLATLRTASFFLVFLLLINPALEQKESVLDKQELLLLTDRSRSVTDSDLSQLSDSLVNVLSQNSKLQDRFEIRRFSFDEALHLSDSAPQGEAATDISKSLDQLLQAHRTEEGAVVLLTDGKQTYGEDYSYKDFGRALPVFPVALGDTTRFSDLRIERVNSNSLAFLNNSFPLEAFLAFEGEGPVNTRLDIFLDGKRFRSLPLQFTKESPTRSLIVNLPASEVGIRRIRLQVQPLEGERNLVNNQMEIAVEVLDEKTRIALVSTILHPDLGALKKAIETNPQRQVSLLKPKEIQNPADYDLFILYTPGESFRELHAKLVERKANRMVVAGPATDWEYLNAAQNRYTYDLFDEGPEEARAILNPVFSRFDISEFDPSGLPPLASALGDLLITVSAETLLEQQIRGVRTGEPVLVALGGAEEKELLWLAQGLWKWRMETYRETGDFEAFDSFIEKLIRYLAEGADRDRLQIRYTPVYQDSRSAILTATYLDEALAFDPEAAMEIVLQDSTGRDRTLRMPVVGNRYEADLSDLPPGDYSFTVSTEDKDQAKTGQFRILNRDVEGQLLRTPYEKLQRLAANTGGNLFFPTEIEQLIDSLEQSDEFSPILRTRKNMVSLISLPWLLFLLATSLAAEWFIRKYNGYN